MLKEQGPSVPGDPELGASATQLLGSALWHVPGQATVPLLVATSPLNQESGCLLQRVLVRSHQDKREDASKLDLDGKQFS